MPLDCLGLLLQKKALYTYGIGAQATLTATGAHELCSGLAYHDNYWTEAKRHPYLVRVAGKLAGFALVKTEKHDDGTPYTYMAEFFIMKKYRGQGIGEAVAYWLFDHYPGDWEVSEIAQNVPAQAFWRKIIGRYTGGQFEEEVIEDGDVLQSFRSPRANFAANGQ